MGRETRTGSVDQAPLCEARGGAGRGLVARWRFGVVVGFWECDTLLRSIDHSKSLSVYCIVLKHSSGLS